MGEFEELDTDEPLPKRIERHAYDRLIMLSDGVYAIVITLAALEIHLPTNWDGSVPHLFASMELELIAYAITFMVTAVFWLGQRRILSQLVRVDMVASVLFLLMLALVALQPAGIRFLIQYPRNPQTLEVYYGLIVLSGLMQALCWGYAAFIGKLVHPEISQGLRWTRFIQALVLPPLLSGISLAVSFRPSLSAFAGMVGLVMVIRLFGRWSEKRFGTKA